MLTIKLDGPALDRLFQGMPEETRLEVANAVVQSFAERHLKPLANSEMLHELRRTIRDAIAAEVREAVGAVAAGKVFDVNRTVTLRDELKDAIRREVDNAVKAVMQDQLATWFSPRRVPPQVLLTAVEKLAEQHLAVALQRADIDAAISDEVERRVRTRLAPVADAIAAAAVREAPDA